MPDPTSAAPAPVSAGEMAQQHQTEVIPVGEGWWQAKCTCGWCDQYVVPTRLRASADYAAEGHLRVVTAAPEPERDPVAGGRADPLVPIMGELWDAAMYSFCTKCGRGAKAIMETETLAMCGAGGCNYAVPDPRKSRLYALVSRLSAALAAAPAPQVEPSGVEARREFVNEAGSRITISVQTEVPDPDALCTSCRWRYAHAPTCKHFGEPWPVMPLEDGRVLVRVVGPTSESSNYLTRLEAAELAAALAPLARPAPPQESALREALAKLEWSASRGGGEYPRFSCCPACKGINPSEAFRLSESGHTDGCWLAAALNPQPGGTA